MKFIKLFEEFGWTNAHQISIEHIKMINDMYGILLPYFTKKEILNFSMKFFKDTHKDKTQKKSFL